MATPVAALNAEVRSLLERTTLGQFLEERAGGVQPVPPIVLDADATVGQAMEARFGGMRARRKVDTCSQGCASASQALANHKISSLPVLASSQAPGPRSERTALFFGFVDVPTIMSAFFKGVWACLR